MAASEIKQSSRKDISTMYPFVLSLLKGFYGIISVSGLSM